VISGRTRPAVRDEPTMHDSFFRIGSDHQQGFVLMVGLLMLAMLSVIGMELARTALLEEKMVGAFVHNLKAFNSAETAIRRMESGFLASDDLTGYSNLIDPECGVLQVDAWFDEIKIRTTVYKAPPNGFNWGDGGGRTIRICHEGNQDLSVEIEALPSHLQHAGDYLGSCAEAAPADPWKTCHEKFGRVGRRLSWQQLSDL
jgi:hypothetical protein